MPAQQGRYFIITWSRRAAGDPDWEAYIGTQSIVHLKGQLELGAGGFEHWQLIVAFSKKVTISRVSGIFEGAHIELTRSAAADAYVHKDDTYVDGTRFEYGRRARKRNSSTDWDLVRADATAGNFANVPSDVYIRYYHSLRRIYYDNLQPVALVRSCKVFWGPTGTGKSRTAWDEGGIDSYAKDPRSKWWCGYRDQENVILDEFRGSVDVSHILRWLDRYPVSVETKGGSVPLRATKFWITSNLHPKDL